MRAGFGNARLPKELFPSSVCSIDSNFFVDKVSLVFPTSSGIS